MYDQTSRHPRAGAAVGLAILVAWLGALGVAFATGDAAEERRVAARGLELTAERAGAEPTDRGR
jgi:hypothetical protein